MATAPSIVLNNDVHIPQLGFGVYQVPPDRTADAVATALEVGYVETWKAMEEIYAGGRCRAIGVSNFTAAHLRRLFDETGTRPAVNQIEVHPYLAQDDLRAFNADHGIVTEAWSPIARGKVLEDPAVVAIAERLGRTPAQVVLRWHIQRGDVVFPKSSSRARMAENFALFNFELGAGNMAALTGLDRAERTGPDPDTFNYIPERHRSAATFASHRGRDEWSYSVVTKSMSSSTRPMRAGSRSVQVRTRARMRWAQT